LPALVVAALARAWAPPVRFSLRFMLLLHLLGKAATSPAKRISVERFPFPRIRDITSLRLVLVKTSGLGIAGRAVHADLHVCHHHEAAGPGLAISDRKHRLQSILQCLLSRKFHPDENQPAVRTGRELTDVGEIEILCHENAPGVLRSPPDYGIVLSDKTLDSDVVRVVSQLCERIQEGFRQILVELQLHATDGMATTGISSSAAAAA